MRKVRDKEEFIYSLSKLSWRYHKHGRKSGEQKQSMSSDFGGREHTHELPDASLVKECRDLRLVLEFLRVQCISRVFRSM